MKNEFLALAAIVLGGASVGAQGANKSSFGVAGMEGTGGAKTQLVLPAPPAGSCPVAMQASHLADGSMVKTDGFVHPVGIGQSLSLTLSSSDGKTIVAATVMVHGMKPIGHMTLTLSNANGNDNIAKRLTVRFRPDRQQKAEAKFWVAGMSAVDRIDLLSLDYSDGSTWKFAGGESCRVIPNPMMLIVGR